MEGYRELSMVTILALIECLVFASLVGRARVKNKIEAPATTGNPEFERYFRVHQNTLEALVVFLPALWIFSMAVHYHLGVALGLLFVIGRIIYASGYIKEPGKRTPGALITFGVNFILVAGSLIVITIKVL
ncbi:MAG TPA: MAPEG family protein [Candidatus Acidoferrales bacterium]|nr:MAPEG family protein [Candidatus Acidoferrales bacterium]